MCVIMKYQSNLLMFGILLLLSYSCNPSRKDIGSIEVDESNDNLLVEYVDEYIDSIASEFHSEMTPIYSVYFFSKKDFTYFTIWTFTDFPSYIEDIVKDTTLKYKPCIIRDRYVIFIYDHESREIMKYLPTCRLIPTEKEIIEKGASINYDGSWYPKTFLYQISDSKIQIQAADTIIVDFLGADYLRFEEFLKEKVNDDSK